MRNGRECTCRKGREERFRSSILHDEQTRLQGRVRADVEVLREGDDGNARGQVPSVIRLTRAAIHSATFQGVNTGDEEAAQEEG
jgi:hypothetical protein